MRKSIALTAAVLVIVMAIGFLLMRAPLSTTAETPSSPSSPSTPTAPPSPAAEIAFDEVTKTRVFFGHQSVGENIMNGIPPAYRAVKMRPPRIIESEEPQDVSGPYFQHARIGMNWYPLTKLADFAAAMRSGVGDQVDVAMVNLGYVDITPETDLDALLAEYKSTMTALEGEFPEVTFMYFTVPVTLTEDKRQREEFTAEHNVTRDKFNQMLRKEYQGTGRLFDLAEAESTTPDGDRVGGNWNGEPYYSLYPPFARDSGHLNTYGGEVVASQMIPAIAAALKSR